MDIRIRPGIDDDLPRIALLHEDVLAEQVVWGMAAPSAAIVRWPRGTLLVATKNEELVGFAFGFSTESAPIAVFAGGQPYFEIAELFVGASHRRVGIGSQLLLELMDTARRQGEARFSLFSATKDQTAVRRFYERHGFVPWGTQFYR